MEETLKSLLEALREINQKLSEVDEELNGTQSELQGFEGEYAKTIKQLQESVEYLNVQIDSTIKAEIKKLPKAENGKDFDPKQLKSMFNAKFEELTRQRKIETTNIKKEIIELVNDIEIPKGEKGDKGENGKSVSNDEIQAFILTWIDDNKDKLKGDTGERGVSGLNGKAGVDGRSIIDVTLKKDVMTIHFSDETTKEIKWPKQKVLMGGGGGNANIENFSYDIVDKVVTIPYNQQMIVMGGITIESELHINGRLILEN